MVLLIFFLILTPVLIQSALKVKLPYADQKSLVQQEDRIRIVITDQQQLFVNEVPVSDLPQLETMLKSVFQKKSIVLIQADRNSNYGFVIKILNIAQKYGATKLELSTQNLAE